MGVCVASMKILVQLSDFPKFLGPMGTKTLK